jgi:protein pelota
MKIIQKDLKHGSIKASIYNLDDLWTLYNVIEKNDLVYAKTTREVKMEGIGRPSSRRVPVSLGLKVERVYFDKEVSRLRVHGIVVEAPEELNIKGSHHTINMAVGDTLIIVKEHWYKHQLDRLEKAVFEEQPAIIVSIDSDECCIAVIRAYGPDVKAEIDSKLPGKLEYQKREEALKKYFHDVLSFLEGAIKEARYKTIVVGPGFTKENFVKFLKNSSPEVASKVVAVKTVTSGGVAGVYESMRSGIVGKVMKDARASREIMLVEEILARLGASRGDVVFGLSQTEEDANAGAVETLLVSDLKLRGAEEDERRRIEETMRTVEKKSGRILLVSNEHEGGKKLNSLGGIAATLRYSRHS